MIDLISFQVLVTARKILFLLPVCDQSYAKFKMAYLKLYEKGIILCEYRLTVTVETLLPVP